MYRRALRSLKEKELLAPAAFVLLLLLVLSLIIVLGQFFHLSLQEEMTAQVNVQQQLLSREVGLNIESFIDHVYKNIIVIAGLPDVDRIQQSPRCRTVTEAITDSLPADMLVAVRVLDRNGILRYDSSAQRREGDDLSRTSYFREARLLPRNERLITDLLDIHAGDEDTKEFIVAVPIYRRPAGAPYTRFRGIVLAVLSLDGITRRYLAPVKSGKRGYAWMMDSDGTLLFHPTQPRMVGKNLYHTDASCFQCHKSFDTEKKMIEGREITSGAYEAPGGENKLIAFYKFPVSRESWIVVVSAPYSDVIALMQKSRRFYTYLILSIFATTLVASIVTIVTYKKKIAAEEKAKHLENHRRLEKQIEIAKDYLEDIIENTRTNLLVLDGKFTVRTVNTAQARTLGLPKEELLGRPFFSLFPDPLPAYEDTPLATILQRTLEGSSFELRDYPVTGLPESPLFLTMNLNPLLIDGREPGVLVTSNDVTKRVQLEEELKQYTVELEDKVDQGAATTMKLEQQVLHSEKLAALGRLAAGVAHEINNPLTSISTFAQMLRESAQDEFTQNSLDIINNHIRRITDIVRRMATFSRAGALQIRSISLNDVVNSSLDLMRFDKRMKSSIRIVLVLDPALPQARLDEGQMSQVFINIILNALDAMPDGGTLTVTTQHGKDDRGRDAVMASFADTGVGISPEDVEKIFDPFYTTKEAGKGTGLGLSVSYDIIKRFNGDIKVESTAGKGTVFTVVLPQEPDAG